MYKKIYILCTFPFYKATLLSIPSFFFQNLRTSQVLVCAVVYVQCCCCCCCCSSLRLEKRASSSNKYQILYIYKLLSLHMYECHFMNVLVFCFKYFLYTLWIFQHFTFLNWEFCFFFLFVLIWFYFLELKHSFSLTQPSSLQTNIS